MSEKKKNSVLIVDDERLNLDLLVKILKDDYTVYMTKSGATAVELANEKLPDVILLDIIMQGMDGFEVLTELKTSEKTKHIPVIFITALDNDEDQEKGLSLQAADYIYKPLKPAIVKLRVGNQIQIVNTIRENKQYAYEAAVSEERSKFFAKMSHEMRTPLNAVIGFSQMTLEECTLSEYTAENINKICNAGTSLLHMVNDILDISKIEEGKFTIIPVDYNFPQIINDTVTQSIVLKGEKSIDFNLHIDESAPLRLFGDDQRIKQILNNLLSNAFKYTKEGTIDFKIESKIDNETVLITFSVSDTGVGIPPENITSIFAEYTRADAQINRKINGTGLGLPITKMLVDMMNGEISVKSEYGKGSCFIVKIPQKFSGSETIGLDAVNSLKNFRYSPEKQKSIVRSILPYANILVVDDMPINLDVAAGMMKPYKMNVDCVTSGQAAVDAIKNEKIKYNAILMDQMMPEMDGIEAVRIIREEIGTEYAKNIPIIAFTANALAGNEEMFLSKGFNGFLPKPVEIKRLDSLLEKWVKNDEADKQYRKDHPEEYQVAETLEKRSGFDRRTGIDRRLNFHAKIEGINYKKGLERFNGDKNTFTQVLRSFAANTRILLETLKDVNKENLAAYAINVHGAKSSCRGICADEAGLQAESLEKAAKAGNLDFVLEKNPLLIENVLILVNNIEDALEKDKANAKKLIKEKPYTEALKQLRAACRDCKIEEVDNVMNEIEVFEYDADDGLVQWLRENVDQLNYMEISQKIFEMFENA